MSRAAVGESAQGDQVKAGLDLPAWRKLVLKGVNAVYGSRNGLSFSTKELKGRKEVLLVALV